MRSMPMGGDSAHAWFAAPAAFIGMWIVMMGPMMLPSLIPALWRYKTMAATRSGAATALAGIGYYLVWLVLGAAAFPLRLALARPAPTVAGIVVSIAGAWQLTGWKARHLACCRDVVARRAHFSILAALHDGVRLGAECARSCGNLMIASLAFGVMDMRAMTLAAAAIALERLAPGGERLARAVGVVALLIGALLIFSASDARPVGWLVPR